MSAHPDFQVTGSPQLKQPLPRWRITAHCQLEVLLEQTPPSINPRAPVLCGLQLLEESPSTLDHDSLEIAVENRSILSVSDRFRKQWTHSLAQQGFPHYGSLIPISPGDTQDKLHQRSIDERMAELDSSHRHAYLSPFEVPACLWTREPAAHLLLGERSKTHHRSRNFPAHLLPAAPEIFVHPRGALLLRTPQ